MRVGVNAHRLAGQRLGIGRYIEYMLKYWNSMLLPSEEVTLYVRAPFDKDSLRLSGAFRVELLEPNLPGSLWENLVLARRAVDLDVLFCPSYTIPLRYRGRSVVATHSVNEAQSGTHPWWYRYTYTPWYQRSAQHADRVIVPSESTRGDVQRHYGIPASKIDIVPEGVDDAFRPLDDPDLIRRTRQRYLGSDRPYILFVGKLSQRRNIPNLMAAFSAVKKRRRLPHALFLMGPNVLGLPLEKLANELGIADSVVQTDGRVADHSELIAVYNAADLYAYPSSYDGFSLTLVEALACGIPVVTVHRAALREIARGCTLMIEEPTVDALTEAIDRALTDEALRADLRTKGLERVRSFRWEDTARRTLEVLRGVAQA